MRCLRDVASVAAVADRGSAGLSEAGYRGLGEAELQSALDRLAEADILFVEGDGAQANYRFKHALIQDAAYESLLKSRRQALHRRAAEALRDSPSARGRARGDRASFHRGRPRRSRDRMVGQGGRPGASPLGLPGGDRPSRQGDRHGGQGGRDGAAGSRRLGRSESATDAIARRLRQRAHRGARPRRAGNDGSLRQSPRVGVRRRGRARTVGGRLRLMGRQLRARRVCRRCGRTRRPSSATSRRDPIRPRPASPIAPPGSLTGSPESIAKRAIIWNARSLCSNPAATTIWPFASDRTPASRRWPTWRSRRGRSARSIARFRSSTACRRGSRTSPMSARSRSAECTRPCSN